MNKYVTLTPEEISFLQLALSRCPFTGIPTALAEFLSRYVEVMNKLEAMKEEQKQEHLDGVGTC